MKRAAAVIILLYIAIFSAFSGPVLRQCLDPEYTTFWESYELLAESSYWIILGILLLCEIGLLVVPVKVASLRPVTRRTIYPLVLTSGFLMGCLFWGLICTIFEFFQNSALFDENWEQWCSIGISVLLWIFWSILFARLAKQKSPRDVVSSQCRHLIKGSILSLLIAVPMHIIVRNRDYCCAGFGTFMGIAFGLSVMLVAFGPGVFFLYADRWKQLHPKSAQEPKEE